MKHNAPMGNGNQVTSRSENNRNTLNRNNSARKPQQKPRKSGSASRNGTTKKKYKILVPKSEAKRKQHIDLLTNIVSIPLLFTNENNKLDVSTDNESFFQVSPICVLKRQHMTGTTPMSTNQANHFNHPNYNAGTCQRYELCQTTRPFGSYEQTVDQIDQDHLDVLDALSYSQSRSYDLFDTEDYPQNHHYPAAPNLAIDQRKTYGPGAVCVPNINLTQKRPRPDLSNSPPMKIFRREVTENLRIPRETNASGAEVNLADLPRI